MTFTFGDLKNLSEEVVSDLGLISLDDFLIYCDIYSRDTRLGEIHDSVVVPQEGVLLIDGEFECHEGIVNVTEHMNLYRFANDSDFPIFLKRRLEESLDEIVDRDDAPDWSILLLELDPAHKEYVKPTGTMIFKQHAVKTLKDGDNYNQFGVDANGSMIWRTYSEYEGTIIYERFTPEWMDKICVPAGMKENPLNKDIAQALELQRGEKCYWGENLYYDPEFPDLILVKIFSKWVWMNRMSFLSANIKEFEDEVGIIESMLA